MRFWKWPIGLIAVALFAVLVFWGLQQSEASRSLPVDLALSNMQGDQISMAQFEGEPVIVNFWATWCPPCVREMPLLADYAKKEGFRLVLINQAESVETIQQYLDEAGLEFEFMLLDSHQHAYQNMQVRGLPTTQFFDHNGRLVNEHLGEVHARHLDTFIDRYVNES